MLEHQRVKFTRKFTTLFVGVMEPSFALPACVPFLSVLANQAGKSSQAAAVCSCLVLSCPLSCTR